jgi:hypothetical protein
MNVNTALIMFAVIAAFGLVTATLVLPIVPQVHAQGQGPPADKGPPEDKIINACQKSRGHAFGGCI